MVELFVQGFGKRMQLAINVKIHALTAEFAFDNGVVQIATDAHTTFDGNAVTAAQHIQLSIGGKRLALAQRNMTIGNAKRAVKFVYDQTVWLPMLVVIIELGLVQNHIVVFAHGDFGNVDLIQMHIGRQTQALREGRFLVRTWLSSHHIDVHFADVDFAHMYGA